MKINFFITSLGGGGAERVVSNLSNYLIKRRHSVTISVLRGEECAYKIDENVEINYLQPCYYKCKEKFYRIKEIIRVVRFVRSIDEDTVLVSFLELPVAFSLLLKHNLKGKLVICERNNPLFYSKTYQTIFKKLSNNADGVICQTEEIAAWYRPHLGLEPNLAVIPNSVNNNILNSPESKRNSCIIVTVGRLTQQKNQKMLIDAFAEISKKHPQYRLFIYGDGPLRKELEEEIEKLGLQDKVSLPGFTNNLIDVLSRADIFVMTSEHEGMPNALAEAMAMGLVCISTDCGGGGARELISNEVNGVLIPRGDKQKLVNSTIKVIEDTEYATHMAEEAIKIRMRLAPESIHKEWEVFFMKVASERH